MNKILLPASIEEIIKKDPAWVVFKNYRKADGTVYSIWNIRLDDEDCTIRRELQEKTVRKLVELHHGKNLFKGEEINDFIREHKDKIQERIRKHLSTKAYNPVYERLFEAGTVPGVVPHTGKNEGTNVVDQEEDDFHRLHNNVYYAGGVFYLNNILSGGKVVSDEKGEDASSGKKPTTAKMVNNLIEPLLRDKGYIPKLAIPFHEEGFKLVIPSS